MVWYTKKTYEDEEIIDISYSHETNDKCDGLLTYDKKSEDISIKLLSENTNEKTTNRLFPIIYGLLSENGLTEQKRRIATG